MDYTNLVIKKGGVNYELSTMWNFLFTNDGREIIYATYSYTFDYLSRIPIQQER